MSPPHLSTTAREPLDLLAGSLDALERAENFPVALRALPRALREDLHAIYGAARTIDTIGDELAGDRLALLDAYAADLRSVWAPGSGPRLAVNRRLVPTVRRHDLHAAPFEALIKANRQDQRVATYPTWNDLRAYCALSADPVGHLVLGVTGNDTPERRAWSDDVCTALQLLEHCQDIGEDHRRGRTYLPADELAQHGVTAADLGAATATAGLRTAVLTQVDRARDLLRSAAPLLRSLRGMPARVAIAGFVAGGLATADAIARCDGDVLATHARPGRVGTIRHGVALLAGVGR